MGETSVIMILVRKIESTQNRGPKNRGQTVYKLRIANICPLFDIN